MCANAINSPFSQGRASRHVVACSKTSLPIQRDKVSVAPWSAEANIKKRLRRKIGTGKLDGVRSTSRNSRHVESQICNNQRNDQRGRNKEFSARKGLGRKGLDAPSH